MKLSKFGALAKRGGYCCIVHGNKTTWMALKSALYKANGVPEMRGGEQAKAVLDMPQKSWDKIFFEEKDADGANILGIDMTENTSTEVEAEELPIQLCYKKGIILTALRCKDGELLFYDTSLTGPVSDIIRDSEYAQIVVRKDAGGRSIVVVKDGFEPLAAILPTKVLNRDFLNDISEMDSLCVAQYEKNCRPGAPEEDDEDGFYGVED